MVRLPDGYYEDMGNKKGASRIANSLCLRGTLSKIIKNLSHL